MLEMILFRKTLRATISVYSIGKWSAGDAWTGVCRLS